MDQTNNALSVRQLSKHYGLLHALDCVDLDVQRAEFLTLLGPSGSGKTTMLLVVAGFEDATSGQILIDGRPMMGIPAHRRRIGMVFQNYALFPHLDVFENVAFGLRNLGWKRPAIASRVAELLELVGLTGLDRRLPSQLSGGQQQRVAIARALSFEPRLLLLDEPLGALDRKLRERMLVELRRIHRTLGVTMLYVSHDQEEALAMSDRIAVMDQGRIVQIGRPDELYERPNCRFVAEFLGEANIFDGVGAGDYRVDVGGWVVMGSEAVPKGSPVSLLVRPEKIALGEGPPGWNTGRGRLEDTLYLGSSTRYRIRMASSRVVTAVAAKQVAPGLTVGDQVQFSWDPGVSLRLPDASAVPHAERGRTSDGED